VPDSVPAQRLLIGETYNPPGLWSSYPPHKHDVQQPPQETKLEEVYHFRLNPPQGFGLQRVYGDGFDECYTAQDRDTVVITKGYHPVVGAPGYQLYYLWILAGEERTMHPRDDDAHAWAKEAK
jgi:5-deoxy-glucuronate isomerase